ncbi:hypothetical protein J27TS8_08920 [Robertmurraya siralis]|uniref:Uncharacterized protein n=1 Tax=Robertmurraya siralis TaxID=77777 RepID=A0A919WFQ2_9BACI|nr:hypothetical protein [Robertmurraya siralis]GIN60899.1 hypothetical protein J27TS8_08920 [Robertmurraya siralis]
MKTFKVLILLLMIIGGQRHVSAEKHMPNEIELIPWDQVNPLLPKYTKFTVRDVITGMEFNVQRRAGNRHADVQPLTRSDTKIMKEIYQGQWSWKRRAIIVLYKGQQIAASMHGMPHGAGALKNNFPGHFCIHFYGSTTHRSNSMDLSHKLMIFKAAGRIYEHLQTANPHEVISAFIAGIKEDDEEIIDMVTIQNLTWGKSLSKVEMIMIKNMPQLPDEDLVSQLQLSVPIELDWYSADVGGKNSHGEIHLFRFLPSEGWKIDAQRFVEDFFEDGIVELKKK